MQVLKYSAASLSVSISRYSDFALVSREKFLRADVNGDKTVDVQDATYIVSNVRD